MLKKYIFLLCCFIAVKLHASIHSDELDDSVDQTLSYLFFPPISEKYTYHPDMLVQEGVDIDVIDKGLTPLHMASSRGLKKSVKELIELGADVNKFSDDGFTPLHYTVCEPCYVNRNIDRQYVTKLLIEAGADINAVDQNLGWSLLHMVAFAHVRNKIKKAIFPDLKNYPISLLKAIYTTCHFCDNQTLVRFINDIKANIAIPVRSSYFVVFGFSLSHFAAMTCQLDEMKSAIDQVKNRFGQSGVELYINSVIMGGDSFPGGYSALNFAARAGDIEAILFLLKNGADINSGLETPLYTAVGFGHPDVVDLLIKEGADINAISRSETPLYKAIKKRRCYDKHKDFDKRYIDIAKKLIDAGADVNLIPNSKLLYEALHNEDGEMVKLLIEAGSVIENMDHFFDWACHLGLVQTVQLLIELGANVNLKGSYGTPLIKAVGSEQFRMAKILIEAGADLNAVRYDLHEIPALYRAIDDHDEKMVKLLIDSGADINSNRYGYNVVRSKYTTPLHYACLHGSKYSREGQEIVRILIEAGAGIDAVDSEGNTPFHYASLGNHVEVMKILIEAGANVDPKIKEEIMNMEIDKPNACESCGDNYYDYNPFKNIDDWIKEKGGDINHAPGDDGNTLLFYILANGWIERFDDDAVKYLIKLGANVNHSNKQGKTPLHLLFDKDTVTNLRTQDFPSLPNDNYSNNFNMDDFELQIPLYSSCDLMKTLIDAGADINPVVKDGLTPFRISFQSAKTTSKNKIIFSGKAYAVCCLTCALTYEKVNSSEFKQGLQEEQEIIISCRVLIQNAIVLWNYLYLSQLLANCTDNEERIEMVNMIKEGSVISWAHINLHGEFDFKRRVANDTHFDMDKILSLRVG